MKRNYPKLIGFEHNLKSQMSHIADNVESTAGINLPIPVQTHISDKYSLGWSDCSARVVYIEPQAHKIQYSMFQENLSSEIR